MRYNYYQFVTNSDLQFKVKAITASGHSYWTLNGSTGQLNLACTFTTDKVSSLCEGYLRDGEYQIIPVIRGELDVHWWLDMMCNVEPSVNSSYWVAVGTMLWEVCEECLSYPNSKEVKDVIENLKDELSLLAMGQQHEAEFIVAGASSIWNNYRKPKRHI